MKINIDKDKTTQFDCPGCGQSKLTPSKNDGKSESINGLSAENRAYGETANEYDETEIHTLAKKFVCTNPECKAATIAVGTLVAYPHYEGEGRIYTTRFSPKYFHPPVRLHTIPENSPLLVQKELVRSYSLFFSDTHAASNALRCAVEKLLDHLGVQKKGSLHSRIESIRSENAENAKLLMSVKWLGNDGSHANEFQVTEDDLLSGYHVFAHVLDEIVNQRIVNVHAKAAEIARGKTI